jgi:hypothetical protein
MTFWIKKGNAVHSVAAFDPIKYAADFENF